MFKFFEAAANLVFVVWLGVMGYQALSQGKEQITLAIVFSTFVITYELQQTRKQNEKPRN